MFVLTTDHIEHPSRVIHEQRITTLEADMAKLTDLLETVRVKAEAQVETTRKIRVELDALKAEVAAGNATPETEAAVRNIEAILDSDDEPAPGEPPTV